MNRIKVCIIGCGMIANNAHIPAYRSIDKYEIVAVCDVNAIGAQKTARQNGINKWYTDAELMLSEEKPDVVSVCAPNMLHKKYVMLALAAGANVLCEKPIALSYKDAKEMFDFAKSQKKYLMACQSLRFLPERQKVSQMIKNGELGDIYFAEMSRVRRRGIPTWGKFHIKEYSGGGSLIDIGVHGIDSALWLMGNPSPISVTANMKKVHVDEIGSEKNSGALKGNVDCTGFDPDKMNVESFSNGMVKFENGASLSFTAAWAANLAEKNNIILSGSKAGVDIENRKIYMGVDCEKELLTSPNGFLTEPFYGHFCIVKNLVDAIAGTDEPFVKPQETLNTTAVIEAAYLSANNNREINIQTDMIGEKL